VKNERYSLFAGQGTELKWSKSTQRSVSMWSNFYLSHESVISTIQLVMKS